MRDPGQAGRTAHGEHHEREDRDTEQAEQRAAPLAALHERVHEHARELSGEQDCRGLAADHREHGRKLVAGPVGPHTNG